MTVEAEETTGDTQEHGDVSGTVINVLVGMVHARSGDVGVAQTLALAGEGRSFATLRDANAWSSQVETVALFNAAALVTGDGAVGLHVGERLLTSSDSTEFTERLVALGSPEVAFKHVEVLAEQFETRSRAAPLQTAPDHALIRVTPRSMSSRHAHLCEMTRGLLSRIPELYGLGPTLITETECSARGGRSCLYALSWEDPSSSDMVGSGTGLPSRNQASMVVDGDEDDLGGDELDHADREPASEERPRPSADPSGEIASDGVVDELRAELDRMSVLFESPIATATELLG